MKSRSAEVFNHDEDAAGYDADVRNEQHPVRAGYRAALRWIGKRSQGCRTILDLGTGTGNTILLLPPRADVVAVDVSRNMLALAREKLAGRRVEFVREDLLEYVDRADARAFDAVVSSFAIHHLPDSEKDHLFRRIAKILRPRGRLVCVDLMYEDAARRAQLTDKYKKVCPEAVEGIQEEFYWDLSTTRPLLSSMGYVARWKRFSDFTWGLAAYLSPRNEYVTLV